MITIFSLALRLHSRKARRTEKRSDIAGCGKHLQQKDQPGMNSKPFGKNRWYAKNRLNLVVLCQGISNTGVV